MLLRITSVLLILGAIGWVTQEKQQTDRELERTRRTLIERWQREAAPLTERNRRMPERAAAWLSRAAAGTAGDRVDDELRRSGGLDRMLERPTVYVRGELDDFSTPGRLESSALDSVKDAFVLCLLDPPRQRTEKSLLSRVRSAYAAGERMQNATRHVQRLGDALIGLPLLDHAWRDRVVAAAGEHELRGLSRTLERAPLEGAKQAAKAALLLYVIDEPGEAGHPTELDGERPHHVRVGLVDLDAGKELLRLRRRVDPSWLSDATRAEYARGVDSCALAFDIRGELAG